MSPEDPGSIAEALGNHRLRHGPLRISASQARALVEAKLGRPPQDRFEASLVLEAWGGISPPLALQLSKEVIAATPRRRPAPSPQVTNVLPVSTLSLTSLLVAMTASVMVVALLAESLGPGIVARSWRVALPTSLALQAILVRRYLNLGEWARLRGDARPAALVAAACALAAGLLPGGGMVASGLVLLWAGAILIGWRGWGLAYALALAVAEALILSRWLLPRPGFLAIVVGTVAAAVAATSAGKGKAAGRPSPWRRVLPSGATAVCFGFLFVVGLPSRLDLATFVAGLGPPMLGGLWAGRQLGRLWIVVPRALAGRYVTELTPGLLRAPVSRLFLGTLARLAAGTAVSALLLLVILPVAGRPTPDAVPLLVTVLPLGLIALISSALDSFGYSFRAIVTVAAAVAGVLITPFLAGGPASGAMAMLVALGAAFDVAAGPMAETLREPDRVLMTSVY